MKLQIKSKSGVLFLFATMLSVVFIGAIQFSCKKDNCTYVHCLNSGTCNNGICTCAPGYTGDTCQNLATSYITYQNNTFTPITITINGYTQNIPIGGSIIYAGFYSDSALGTAMTTGSGGTGGTVGETVTWTLANAFAVNMQTVPIDVSSVYYYLKVADSGSIAINKILANQSVMTETANVTIPNNGVTYGIGYFYAYSNSTIRAVYANGSDYADTSMALPMTLNQSFTFGSH